MTCCHNCATPIDTADRVGRTDTCPGCSADLHCCLNCRFYEPGAHNQCREPEAERVVDKDRSNFCDLFAFKTGTAGSRSSRASKKGNPLDSLFKKK